MRKRIPNLTGQRNKYLSIFDKSYCRDKQNEKRTYYLCKCECNNLIYIDQKSLFYKKITSCGCRGSKTVEERKLINKKKCGHCLKVLSLDNFTYNQRNKDNLEHVCKVCSKSKRNKINYKYLYLKQKERYKIDISLKLRKYIGSHICHALQSKNITKAGKSWSKLLGYNAQELKEHLDQKLQLGMTWENYGSKWHVDHIIPASWWSFNSPDDPEFKQCWCLANLQPKLASENLSKNNRYVG